MAYVFTLARKRNLVILYNWGEKVLKDPIQVGTSSNYNSKRYVGCGQVITRIIYHSLGMTDQLVEIADKDHAVWEELGERREATQRETRGKHKAMEGDQSFEEEEEQEAPAAAAGFVAVPASAPAPLKQKIKIKLKVAQKEQSCQSMRWMKTNHYSRKDRNQCPHQIKRGKRKGHTREWTRKLS